MTRRPSPFALAVATVSILVTAVMAGRIWESYYPDPDREALAARRAYYEKTLRKANVSWHEARHYKVLGAGGPLP